jgi:hypothetical protein
MRAELLEQPVKRQTIAKHDSEATFDHSAGRAIQCGQRGVALTVNDGGERPSALTAITTQKYLVPLVSPLTFALVADAPVLTAGIPFVDTERVVEQ